jgi:hypothetical protein
MSCSTRFALILGVIAAKTKLCMNFRQGPAEIHVKTPFCREPLPFFVVFGKKSIHKFNFAAITSEIVRNERGGHLFYTARTGIPCSYSISTKRLLLLLA